MSQFRTCPDCGANLDPGERCDCRDTESFVPHRTGSLRQTAPIGSSGTIEYTEKYMRPWERGKYAYIKH